MKTLKERIIILEKRLENLKEAHEQLVSLATNEALTIPSKRAFASEANRIEGKWKELSRTLIQIR